MVPMDGFSTVLDQMRNGVATLKMGPMVRSCPPKQARTERSLTQLSNDR